MKVIKLPFLLRELYSLLESYSPKVPQNVLGTLHSALGNRWKYEAVVDKWPEFGALLLRPCQYVPKACKYQEVYMFCTPKNLRSLRYLLSRTDSLPWDEDIVFPGCPVQYQPVLELAAQKHQGRLFYPEGKGFQVYHAKDRRALIKMKLRPPEELYFGPLKEEHAPLVYQKWVEFAGTDMVNSRSEDNMRDLIRNSVTACLFDRNHNPVSWVLGHYTGAGLYAYTLPEYRGKGLYGLVGIYFTKQSLEFGQPHVHAIADVENKAVQSAVDNFFETLPGYTNVFHFIPTSGVLDSKL